MNATCLAPPVSFQDITALVAAIGSVLATILLSLQFIVDHRRSSEAGVATPGGILVSTISGSLTPRSSTQSPGRGHNGGANPEG